MSLAPKNERKATRQRVTPIHLLHSFFLRHIQTALGSFGRLYKNPVSSLLTIMVIGIALAFPGGLYLVLKNFQVILGEWNPNPKISLYLNDSVSEPTAINLTRELSVRPEIESAEYISPDKGLREVAETTGIANIVEILGENPLPRVIVVVPVHSALAPARIDALLHDLENLNAVHIARLDLKWVQRLTGYIEVAQRGLLAIIIMLALGVLLIIGNTIRLEIFNRKDEIITCKLIGATNAFIRRPFLYSGLWYGFAGGLFSCIAIEICVYFIHTPVMALAISYQSPFTLAGLSLKESSLLILIGLLLGLTGSFTSVSRHLRQIEPE